MNGKTGNLGNVVHIERFKNKITVVSEKQFSKRLVFVFHGLFFFFLTMLGALILEYV